jgi:YHS domain-containing protein
MPWLTRILLVIVLLMLVGRALRRLMAGVRQGMNPGGQAPRSMPRGVPMERDPVCGTFVVPSRARVSSDGDGIHYFCSDKCRKAYRPGEAGRRASGR